MKMEKEQKFLDPLQDFRDKPKKLKAFIDSLPKSERALAERCVKLQLEIKSNLEELKAQRIIRKANAIEQLKAQSKQKSDPFFLLEFVSSPITGIIEDMYSYLGTYHHPSLILPEFLIFPNGGGVLFMFNGLPVGTYLFYVDWYMVTGQKKCKIECRSHSTPLTAVSPQGTIVKYTEEPTPGQLFSGMDMVWNVIAPNDGLHFCITNVSDEYIASVGVFLLGLY